MKNHRHLVSHSKSVFSQFVNLYLHSKKARIVFALVILDVDSRKHSINWGHRSRFSRFFYRIWLRMEPKLLAPYQKVILTRTLACLLVLSGFITLMQLSYPRSLSLPLARLEGSGLTGLETEAEITGRIADLDQRAVTVKTKTGEVSATYSEMGLDVDSTGTFENLSDYSVAERLLPFSIFFNSIREGQINKSLDEPRFADFTSKIITNSSLPPIDARVDLEGTKLEITAAQDGYAYHQSSLQKQILRADLYSDEPLEFAPEILTPNITTAAAQAEVDTMQRRLDTSLMIYAEDKKLLIDASKMSKWVKIAHKPNDRKVEIRFDGAKVARDLRPLAATVDVQPVPTVVTLLNGVEAGRSLGKNGRTLQFDKLVSQVADSVSAASKDIWGSVDTILPPETKDRHYTRDSQGIQSLISYWTNTHLGSHGIAMQTLDGQIYATHDPNRQFPISGAANLFIAHQVYGKITAGNLSSNAATSAGPSVGSCINQMIAGYSQSCMYALGNIIGWAGTNGLLDAQGFYETSLSQGNEVTTADNLAKWFRLVQGRAIVTGPQSDNLITAMRNSARRDGLPAGSFGISVANHAGISSSGVLYDAGIIFHPRKTYVLAVMTSSASLAQVAELAREINKVLYE